MAKMAIRPKLLETLGQQAYNELADAFDTSDSTVLEKVEDKFEVQLAHLENRLTWKLYGTTILIVLSVIITKLADNLL